MRNLILVLAVALVFATGCDTPAPEATPDAPAEVAEAEE